MYPKLIGPVPVAAQSKAWVCGRTLSGTVGSNLARGMDVYRKCCILSSGGLCDELIASTEESYRVWCVIVCDL